MQLTFDQARNRVSIRLEDQDLPHVAVEELKKERAKRERLESQMALVLEKLGMREA